jgi:hypothetical protein
MKHILSFLTPADPWHLVACATAVLFVVLLNLVWYHRGRRYDAADAVRRVREG